MVSPDLFHVKQLIPYLSCARSVRRRESSFGKWGDDRSKFGRTTGISGGVSSAARVYFAPMDWRKPASVADSHGVPVVNRALSRIMRIGLVSSRYVGDRRFFLRFFTFMV